ncbi:MAG: glycosyltransferase [Bacteroidota bacterium]
MLQITVVVLALLTMVCWLILVYHYWFQFYKLASHKPKSMPESVLPPVSVVICARNEAQNLFKFLPKIFSQEYPEFQVVVVNDCSWDESEHILEEFQAKHKNLHVVHLKEEEIRDHDKKLALTLGIKGAKFPHLVFTDADCYPSSTQWLKQMAQGFDGNKQIVVAYAPYEKTRGFLNRLVRLDAFLNAIQYLSAALANKTYMAVGRNMAYTREIFFENKGFASQYYIQSGDDDLFVNKIAKPGNSSVVIHPDAFTYTPSKKKFRHWIWQKKRHLSASAHYKFATRLKLGAYAMANFLFFPLCVSLLFLPLFPLQHWYILSAWLPLFLSKALIRLMSARRLRENDLWWFSFLGAWVLAIIYPYLHFTNLFTKRHRWK